MLRVLLLLCFCLSSLQAQKVYTYVGELGPDFVVLAWGTTEGRTGQNTIGRGAPGLGKATVKVGPTTVETDKSWVRVSGLQADTNHNYEVFVNGKKVGGGSVRTWPQKTDKFTFFIIGDWGSGDSRQYRIADAMAKEFEKRWNQGEPVRFVLSLGDNLYSNSPLFMRDTGKRDRDWEDKYFKPYESIIRSVPFYPVLGNHDGNESEDREDLTAYLDNFFFPGGEPGRYYRFSFAGFADFFALDSSMNTEQGPVKPAYAKDNDQHRWLAKNLAESQVPWKIVYYHNPPFNSGPRHISAVNEQRHWLELMQRYGVQAAFNGHEHNFQVSDVNKETYGVRFVVSGAGGELRKGGVTKANMEKTQILGWAPQNHFCVVEVDKKTMTITPLSDSPVIVKDRNFREMNREVTVQLP